MCDTKNSHLTPLVALAEKTNCLRSDFTTQSARSLHEEPVFALAERSLPDSKEHGLSHVVYRVGVNNCHIVRNDNCGGSYYSTGVDTGVDGCMEYDNSVGYTRYDDGSDVEYNHLIWLAIKI